MGRLALRAAVERPEISIVHINELKGDPYTALTCSDSTASMVVGACRLLPMRASSA